MEPDLPPIEHFLKGFCEDAPAGLCTEIMSETIQKIFDRLVSELAPQYAYALGHTLIGRGDQLLAPGADTVGLHEGGLTWYLPEPRQQSVTATAMGIKLEREARRLR